LLLGELARVLAYPKLEKRITADEAAEYVALLRTRAVMASDPTPSARRAPDPRDEYLLSLAEAERALLVSGDEHLLGLGEAYPIISPRVFVETLETHG
jgi:putative PIN family toxin of toxin-antitoxin system